MIIQRFKTSNKSATINPGTDVPSEKNKEKENKRGNNMTWFKENDTNL